MTSPVSTLSPELRFYGWLSRLPYLKSYKAKIMVIAFVGTHIPLLALIIFCLSYLVTIPGALKLQLIGVALLATLFGTAAVLLALHRLLAPVVATSRALQVYEEEQILPDLPTHFEDEAGSLMASVVSSVQRLDELMYYVANHDNVTGLPNQIAIADRLQAMLNQTLLRQEQVLVLYIMLENFKTLKNLMGKAVSNQILQIVAGRLKAQTRNRGLVAQLSSDEFVLILTCPAGTVVALEQIQHCIQQLALPCQLKTGPVRLSTRIGVARYPVDSSLGEDLISQAATALQQTTEERYSSYRFYDSEVNAQLQTRLRLETDLGMALERQELLLYYQPRIQLETGQLVGAEALLRWQHPTLGMVLPAEFIPIAEETGLILPIGEWVLRTACNQLKQWQSQPLPEGFKLSVNLSARQFQQPDLVEVVQQILAETAVKAAALELEVTESLIMADVKVTTEMLSQLHQQGVALALDDFGTGYSSLGYLRQFPFDTLKIDRSFVQDVTESSEAAAVVKAIVTLAKSLGLGIVAEGIETRSQLTYLQSLQCDEGQGYHFARPEPAAAIALRFPQPTSVG
ncbi:EAL domain-containing protein [Romeria aff. gracilis LEGE 07310]|uniref:EAL domain-containing protein n=1 Tax=Vasconcelosia minhoensis LEGE 07310 TaxID=915328 RepID=A0A8J7AZP0_9CYAN|nr:GGDEF domain-containing phosphodiesterase [Romeria gracilis]MBE9079377.1 EAL domain-containing protein [Romeria aff. gracilis LEGE 07310]